MVLVMCLNFMSDIGTHTLSIGLQFLNPRAESYSRWLKMKEKTLKKGIKACIHLR